MNYKMMYKSEFLLWFFCSFCHSPLSSLLALLYLISISFKQTFSKVCLLFFSIPNFSFTSSSVDSTNDISSLMLSLVPEMRLCCLRVSAALQINMPIMAWVGCLDLSSRGVGEDGPWIDRQARLQTLAML